MRNTIFLLAVIGCIAQSPSSEPSSQPSANPEAHLVASSWSDLVQARIHDGQFQLRQGGWGHRFTNSSTGVVAHLDPDSVIIEPLELASDEAAWSVSVETVGVGFGVASPSMGGVPQAGPCRDPARLDAFGECLRRSERPIAPGVVEWWENSEAGLEQGWTVDELGDGDLVIEVAFAGFQAEVAADGLSAELSGSGVDVGYEGLSAWDGSGSPLQAWMETIDQGIRIRVDTAGAVAPITVDPLVSTPTVLTEGVSGRFGLELASAGDVNGDGFDDVVVGAPLYDNGESNEGRAFVYFGNAGGLSPVAAWAAESDLDGGLFSATLASADLDGDGFDDLVVGAPGAYSAAGQVFAYFGSSSGPSATPSWIRWGGVDDRLGSALAAGDVNGDGFWDLVVGAPQRWPSTGEARVFHGSVSGPGWMPDSVIPAPSGSFLFGGSIAGGGDLDGDGYDDLVVNAEQQGVWAFTGSASGVSSGPVWSLASQQGTEYLAFGMDIVGDVDGDGYDDLAIGAHRFDNPEEDEGIVRLYPGGPTGPANAPTWTAESGVPLGLMGWDVARAGDVNGDGYADVLIGSPGVGSGTASVYLGRPNGLQETAAWSVSGPSGSFFGSAVASADVNGDGLTDVLVGGRTANAAFLFLAEGVTDDDLDGFGAFVDCDDDDPLVNPAATDLPGNGVDEDCDGEDAGFGLSTLGPGDLVLTELMHSPVAGNATWFEVLNTSGVRIDLKGLEMAWTAGSHAVPGALNVDPDQRVVFADSTYADVTAHGEWGAGLPLGSSDALTLSLGSTVFDQVAWDGTWIQSTGASLSVDPALEHASDNDDASAWCDGRTAFPSFGTPGEPNDPCAFTLTFRYRYQLDDGSNVHGETTMTLQHPGPAFTTGNSGEGTYSRTTTASGQTLQWTYEATGVVYVATRPFGDELWCNGSMTGLPTGVASGTWAETSCP